jgi:tetratricopeptide (TPR) repeat protein
MAESGGIEELMGADPGDGESERKLGGADALAMALAIEQARLDPELSRKLGAYVETQRELTRLQVRHFDEEHRLAIAAARRKALSDRMRIGLQVLVALIGAAAILGVTAMVWGAITDRGIVIDAISVPADLAERGFTGQVIAKQILDRLAEINATSSPARAANSYANSWSGDLKLQIPETGVSLGELSRVLHDSLGHATHVGGDVTHSGDDITVKIRVGDEYTAEATGPQASLKALVQDAATKIYARTQPYRYGFWLYASGHSEAATAVFQQLEVSGPDIERLWALHGLSLAADSNRRGIAYDQQALALDPKFFLSRLTIAEMEYSLGHDERALAESTAVIAAEQGNSDSTLARSAKPRIQARAAADRAEALGDYQGMIVAAATVASVSEGDAAHISAWRGRISGLIDLHDIEAASSALGLLAPAATGSAGAQSLRLQARVAAACGDWAAAIPDLERARILLADSLERHRDWIVVAVDPLLAEAYAHLGRNAEADALLAGIPADVYDGQRARARVATLRADYAGGETAIAEAVRQAPSIPRAYMDWGDLLSAKGDLAGALVKYAAASRLGPNWADPLKAWGDLLVKQGSPREALEKYDQALKHAPHWAALSTARAAVAQPH